MKNVKRTGMAMALLVAATIPCFAAEADLQSVVTPIVSLLNSLVGPLLAVVGAVGALYCILLGVKYARAEEPQDREKAKQHLKGAIIGFGLIFVLLVVLNLLMPVMSQWASDVIQEAGEEAAKDAAQGAGALFG